MGLIQLTSTAIAALILELAAIALLFTKKANS